MHSVRVLARSPILVAPAGCRMPGCWEHTQWEHTRCQCWTSYQIRRCGWAHAACRSTAFWYRYSYQQHGVGLRCVAWGAVGESDGTPHNAVINNNSLLWPFLTFMCVGFVFQNIVHYIPFEVDCTDLSCEDTCHDVCIIFLQSTIPWRSPHAESPLGLKTLLTIIAGPGSEGCPSILPLKVRSPVPTRTRWCYRQGLVLTRPW